MPWSQCPTSRALCVPRHGAVHQREVVHNRYGARGRVGRFQCSRARTARIWCTACLSASPWAWCSPTACSRVGGGAHAVHNRKTSSQTNGLTPHRGEQKRLGGAPKFTKAPKPRAKHLSKRSIQAFSPEETLTNKQTSHIPIAGSCAAPQSLHKASSASAYKALRWAHSPKGHNVAARLHSRLPPSRAIRAIRSPPPG
jgi:hypothetical protein